MIDGDDVTAVLYRHLHLREAPYIDDQKALPQGPYLILGLGNAGSAAAEALLAARAAERVHGWDSATAGAAWTYISVETG